MTENDDVLCDAKDMRPILLMMNVSIFLPPKTGAVDSANNRAWSAELTDLGYPEPCSLPCLALYGSGGSEQSQPLLDVVQDGLDDRKALHHRLLKIFPVESHPWVVRFLGTLNELWDDVDSDQADAVAANRDRTAERRKTSGKETREDEGVQLI